MLRRSLSMARARAAPIDRIATLMSSWTMIHRASFRFWISVVIALIPSHLKSWQARRACEGDPEQGMASLPNVASQRVLEKIGLERRGERSFPHPAYAAGGPLAWFEREADAWLAERQPSTGGSVA